MSLNVDSALAQSSPLPQATLQVYNPNASPVAVTGIAVKYLNAEFQPFNAATNLPMPAMGPGQTVVVPALASLFFGPFSVTLGMAGNANMFLAAPQTAPLSAMSRSELANRRAQRVFVGATVYGSDGSINEAGLDSVLFSWSTIAPIGLQGGNTNFTLPMSSGIVAAIV